jgi:hypothetical protein
VIVLGAGVRSIGAAGDDFEWRDYWHVVPRSTAQLTVPNGTVRRVRGDGLLVGKRESASGLIFWNGKRYVWEQQDN